MTNEADNLPVVVDDGFEDSGGTDRLIQGTILRCVDGRWSTRDGDIPTGKRLIALATTEALQCWREGTVIDEIIKVPGESLPDIDELNAKFPKETWEQRHNEPRAPWVHSYVAYLLDPADASLFTFINSTNGAEVAVNRLKERVRWMRQLRGARVSPVVALGGRLVSKKFGKLGPDFKILEWRDLGGGNLQAPPTAPQQIEHQDSGKQAKDPVKQAGRPVKEPDLAEILDDDLPDELK
jgi:hypothetical protein